MNSVNSFINCFTLQKEQITLKEQQLQGMIQEKIDENDKLQQLNKVGLTTTA